MASTYCEQMAGLFQHDTCLDPVVLHSMQQAPRKGTILRACRAVLASPCGRGQEDAGQNRH